MEHVNKFCRVRHESVNGFEASVWIFEREENMKFLNPLAVMLTAAISVAGAASADTFTLTVAAGQPPRALPSLGAVEDFFVPEVNARLEASGSEHAIRFREAYAGSLIRPTQVLQGVQDGLADIGYVPVIFHPDKLPLEQISFVTPFCSTDVGKVTAAMDRVYAELPAMADQYSAFNQVRLAGTGVDSYELHSSVPVRGYADLAGLKIAAPGGALNWMRGTELTPVQSNMMEFYNSTRTGVYDGFIVMGSTIFGMKYPEVAPYITEVNFGSTYVAVLTMNKDSLSALPEDVQAVIWDVAADYQDVANEAYQRAGEAALVKLPDWENGELIAFDASDRNTWANALPNLAREWATGMDAKGLPGTQALEIYMNALADSGENCARDWRAD